MLDEHSPDPNPLAQWIRPGVVLPDLEATTIGGVFDELANHLANSLTRVSSAEVRRGLSEREELGTTAVGNGFAIPHCRLTSASEVHLKVARHPLGVDFRAPDGLPVRVFFALVAPQDRASAHLEALRAIARFLRDPERRDSALAAQSAADLLARIQSRATPGLRDEVTADA